MAVKVFVFPFKATISVNQTYYHIRNQRHLTVEAVKLRLRIKEYIKKKYPLKFEIEDKIKVELYVYENWNRKDGLTTHKDIANREKFFIDSVFPEFGFDDCHIWDFRIIKMQSEIEQTRLLIDGCL